MHKNSINTPERPIVNGIQFVGARMGQFLDHHLQPLAQKNRSYLRNTKHLIQLLGELQIEDRPCILATANVNSFYTIIGHQEAMKATQWALKHLSDTPRKLRAYLMENLNYC